MKRVLILAIIATPLWCANTTVTANFIAPTQDPVSGFCTIQAVTAPATNGSYRIVGAPVQVSFTSGAFSVSLVPTDAQVPGGQYYSVTCTIPSQTVNGHRIGPYPWGPKLWLVPTSATPLDISAVEYPNTISALPLPTDGQVLAWVASTGMYAPKTIDTSVVGENGNLYFTTGRARLALSGSGPISYGNTTGIIDCPTCLLNSGSYSDPSWLSLSASGGRISGLGGAAVLNVGSGSNTVAAGNDPRFVKRILWSNTFMDTPESDATSGYRAFGTGGETIYFSFDLLADWPGSLTFNLTGWSTTATLAPTITVQHVCISSGGTATKSYAHSQSVTVAPAAASGRSVATPLALDLTGCAAGSEYFAELSVAGNTTAFNLLRAWVTE